MARYGQQAVSKREQHRLDVARRKGLPFIKRRKQRRYTLPFPSGFFAMARENEREGVLMTRVQKKPPRFFLEHIDANGVKIEAALQELPKGQRGYTLLLEGGGFHEFKTQRRALKFFSRLQKVESDGDIHTDEQSAGVPDTDIECAGDPESSEG